MHFESHYTMSRKIAWSSGFNLKVLYLQNSCLLTSVVQVPRWGVCFPFFSPSSLFDFFCFPSLKLFGSYQQENIRYVSSYFVLFLFFTGKWVLWVLADRCGSLRIVVGRCGSLCVVLGSYVSQNMQSRAS